MPLCNASVRARQGWLFLVAVLVFTTSPALGATSWVLKGRGSSVYAEAGSQKPGARLVLDCQELVKLYYYIPRGWDGARLDSMFVAIDGARIPVTADGVDAAVILSDLPNEAVGISAPLLSRMKTGKKLVILGSATAKIQSGQLTFSLEGAAAVITAFERRCPTARRPLS
jgi:hypothetical protein